MHALKRLAGAAAAARRRGGRSSGTPAKALEPAQKDRIEAVLGRLKSLGILSGADGELARRLERAVDELEARVGLLPPAR
mmetsp:Transcript_21258/g.68843  ORF Transcript_21258/g.68843 Transcript_21258/m.68843 type:complete len:80 (-) Transcript_21258:38-277(-)